MKPLKVWSIEVHQLAIEKGWNPPVSTEDVLARLALIHSEVSEALEFAREGSVTALYRLPDSPTGKPEGFGIELADVIIRTMDLAMGLGIDIEYCINRKHEYNKTRPYRHGNKRA